MSTMQTYELFEELQHEITRNYKKIYSGSRYLTFRSDLYPACLTLSWMLVLALMTSSFLSQGLPGRTPGVVLENLFYSIILGFSGLFVAGRYQEYQTNEDGVLNHLLNYFINKGTLYPALFMCLVLVSLSSILYFAMMALDQSLKYMSSYVLFYTVTSILGLSGLFVAGFYRKYKKQGQHIGFLNEDTLYMALFIFLVPVSLSFSLYFAMMALGQSVDNLFVFILLFVAALNIIAYYIGLVFRKFVLPFLPFILTSIVIDDLSNTRRANDLSYDALIKKTVTRSISFVSQHSKDTIKAVLLMGPCASSN